MGIREEIERLLRVTAKAPWLKGKYISRDDVLSILDEHLGELVGQVICTEGQARIDLMNKAREDDHISIYVRRKEK